MEELKEKNKIEKKNEIKKKKISLIIPCYNEEEVLGILHEELKKVTGKMPQYNFEFLFVMMAQKIELLKY